MFAELILVWMLTSSVLSEAHAFNAFTMADKPVEKASSLTEKKHALSGDIKNPNGC